MDFQSEKPRIHILLKSMKGYYKTLLRNFVKRDLTNNNNLEQFVIEKEIFDDVEIILLCPKAAFLISEGNIPIHKINEIKKVCRNYYFDLCNQITKMINFGEKILTALEILDPANLGESLIPIITIFQKLVPKKD